jgi:hypothetical protein
MTGCSECGWDTKTQMAGSFDPAIKTPPITSESSPRLLLRLPRRHLLLNRPLQLQRPWRKLRSLRLDQKRIQPAAMIDALQRIGRDAQADVAAERVGDEGDVAEVGQEPALGLDVGVAHLVAHLGALGG